jgi:hypothetical protein
MVVFRSYRTRAVRHRGTAIFWTPPNTPDLNTLVVRTRSGRRCMTVDPQSPAASLAGLCFARNGGSWTAVQVSDILGGGINGLRHA